MAQWQQAMGGDILGMLKDTRCLLLTVRKGATRFSSESRPCVKERVCAPSHEETRMTCDLPAPQQAESSWRRRRCSSRRWNLSSQQRRRRRQRTARRASGIQHTQSARAARPPASRRRLFSVWSVLVSGAVTTWTVPLCLSLCQTPLKRVGSRDAGAHPAYAPPLPRPETPAVPFRPPYVSFSRGFPPVSFPLWTRTPAGSHSAPPDRPQARAGP